MSAEVPPWDHGSPRDLGRAPHLRAAFEQFQSQKQGSTSYHLLLDSPPTRQEFFACLPVGTPRFCLGKRLGVGLSWKKEWSQLRELPESSGSLWHSVRFDLEKEPAPEWASFGKGRSWLPQIELHGAHIFYHPRNHSHELLEAILASASPKDSILTPNGFAPSSLPARENFIRIITALLPELRGSLFQKVVPAIRHHLPLEKFLDPVLLLDAIAKGNGPGTSFLLDWGDGCFLGHSPEQLFERDGLNLSTMALAGTRPRGSTSQEDQELADDLLGHPKDQEEHALVRDWLLERLQPISDQITCPSKPEIFALNTLQHLLSPVRANLKPDVRDAHLLDALFPTPAVLGHPSTLARQWLRTHEGFDRGLFAGLMGVSSSHHGTWTVCIRSLLCDAQNAWLYAGAGVVADSNPAEEWNEIQRKLLAPLRVIHDFCNDQEQK